MWLISKNSNFLFITVRYSEISKVRETKPFNSNKVLEIHQAIELIGEWAYFKCKAEFVHDSL